MHAVISRGRSASRPGASFRGAGSRVGLGLLAGLSLGLGLSSCAYLEQARLMTDASAATVNQAAIETLVQADIERQRLRNLRCLDPLLTPLTIKTAAADPRLGQRWLDELVHDCPELAAAKAA